MAIRVPAGEKVISEGTGGYGGTLGKTKGTARTSEDKEDRGRQQGKGNRGKQVQDVHLRNFPTPLRPALLGTLPLVAFTYLNRPSSMRTKAGYLQCSDHSHRPCSTNQVSGAQSLLCHSLAHTELRICKRQLSDGPATAQGAQGGKPEGQVIGIFFSFPCHGLKHKAHEPRRMPASVPSKENFHKLEIVI